MGYYTKATFTNGLSDTALGNAIDEPWMRGEVRAHCLSMNEVMRKELGEILPPGRFTPDGTRVSLDHATFRIEIEPNLDDDVIYIL